MNLFTSIAKTLFASSSLIPVLLLCFVSSSQAGSTPQTIAFPAIANPTTSQSSVSLGATASSGLPVSYSVVGGGNVASVTGSTVTLSGTPGAATIAANQAGNATYASAPVVYQTFLVQSGNTATTTWKFIAGGGSSTLAIRSDGTLWGWGYDADGVLGDGTTAYHTTPVQIGSANNWQTISMNAQTMALKTDGTLWVWGHNYYGELGDGTETDHLTPEQVGTAHWISIGAGYGASYAIKSDGTLWTAGNYNTSFTQVGTDTDWQSVTASYSHELLIKTSGALWAMGDNSSGELGIGSQVSSFTTPEHVGTSTWKAASAGSYVSVAIRSDSTLWSWGSGIQYGLGNGGSSSSPQETPLEISTTTDWQSVSCGGAETVALKTDGSLWAWGDNQRGEMGNGTLTPVPIPTATIPGRTWLRAIEGTLAIAPDGSLWSWGGSQPQLYPTHGIRPIAPGFGSVASFALDSTQVEVVKQDGTLWAWGQNSSAGLGDGTSIPHATPEQIGTATNWRTVSFGSSAGDSSLALKSDGTLWGWGVNSFGELGNGTTGQVSFPSQVTGSTVWSSVCTSNGTSLGIKPDGSLWSWGSGSNGQLGYVASGNQTTPEQVGTATNWKMGSIGVNFALAIKADGTLWSWGTNAQGQLGNGTTTSSSNPGQVGTDTHWTAVRAGQTYGVALKSDGTLWAWGNNSSGQLGNGTTTSQTVPQKIGTSTNWVSFAPDSGGVMALKSDGSLWAWGDNSSGQLGDGTMNAQYLPEQIQPGVEWSSLPDGGMLYSSTTLVQSVDGLLWGWGNNFDFELAGAGVGQTVPQEILITLSPQSLSFPSVSAVMNVPVTLAATASSGLPVIYSVSGPATLTGNQLTVTSPGTVYVTAYQPGDANWMSTGPVTGSITVAFSPTFNSASYVPVTSNGFSAVGQTLNLNLGFAPPAGTVLTVINNTGTAPLTGTFANLGNGGAISATYGSSTYTFMANYQGGDGNDLTLTLVSVTPASDTPTLPPGAQIVLAVVLLGIALRYLPAARIGPGQT